MTTSLNQLKKEISALGDVNIGSIAEYEEVNERFTFLSGQRDDMLTARQKLDKVIEEMDKIMTSRFRDAYLQLSEDVYKRQLHTCPAQRIGICWLTCAGQLVKKL